MSFEDSVKALEDVVNKATTLAKECYIFRASSAFNCQYMQKFLDYLKTNKVETQPNYTEALRQIIKIIEDYIKSLEEYSKDKWLNYILYNTRNYNNDKSNTIETLQEVFLMKFLDSVKILTKNSLTIPVDPQQQAYNKKSDLSKIRKKLTQILVGIDENSPEYPKVKLAIEKITEIEGQKSIFKEKINNYMELNINENDLDYNLSQNDHLGAGGFGTVSKATKKNTSEFVAVKKFRGDKLSPISWYSIFFEIFTMCNIHHPCVLELVGAHVTEPYCIITRFCSGRSLFDRLHRAKMLQPLTQTELTKIAYQVASGMCYLHSQKIVHRDLKTLNILLDDKNNACIADFGLSGKLEGNETPFESVGTPHYSAPEILVRTRNYDNKVDVYSYAIVLWEMLTKEVPFNDKVLDKIYEHVVTFGWRLPIPSEASPGLVKLITQCWAKDPKERPEFSEIVQQFESGLIKFPDSDDIDYAALKKEVRCPPINEEYAISVLKDPNHQYFGGVLQFIAEHIDAHVVEILQKVNVIDKIVQNNKMDHFNYILLLASNLLSGVEEWISFLESGGELMLNETINNSKINPKYGALRFLIRMPDSLLNRFSKLLPNIIKILDENQISETEESYDNDNKDLSVYKHILCVFRVVVRFNDLNEQYKEKISQVLPSVLTYVVKQAEALEANENFETVISLFSLVKDIIDHSQICKFYPLISFVSEAMKDKFVDDLQSCSYPLDYPAFVIEILKALHKVELGSHLVKFLLAEQNFPFDLLWKQEGLFGILKSLLLNFKENAPTEQIMAPLLVMFCISQIKEAALAIAKQEDLMSALFDVKGYDEQKLQILTALTSFEEFCTEKNNVMDSTVHLLALRLMDEHYRDCSIRLISAMSSHQTGCSKLADNGVFQPFVQLFCSSSIPDSLAPNKIIKNALEHHAELQQASVIVSCLMQRMVNELSHKEDILDTLTVLILHMEGSVQVHDIKTIIIPLIYREDPQIVYRTLKLLNHVNPVTLERDSEAVSDLLSAINEMLSNEDMMYPSIIEMAVQVIVKFLRGTTLDPFLETTKLSNFLIQTVEKFPDDESSQKLKKNILDLVNRSFSANKAFLPKSRALGFPKTNPQFKY